MAFAVQAGKTFRFLRLFNNRFLVCGGFTEVYYSG